MPEADVTLDGVDCIVTGDFLVVQCVDIKLDAPSRRSGAGGERRALVHGFSDELVVNFGEDYPGGVTIRGDVRFPGKIAQDRLRFETHDIELNHPDRRGSGSGHRRALVHGFEDQLVLNWSNDYTGGTVCHGDFRIERGGEFQIHNQAGDVIAEINQYANLTLGGPHQDGDLILRDAAGQQIFRLDPQYRAFYGRDSNGVIRLRIDIDHITASPWPVWPGESPPSRVDLMKELRRLKEEVVALRTQVDQLTSG